MAKILTLDEGRNAFARREWKEAFTSFSKADSDSSLGPVDLEQLGNAAYLIGKDDEAILTWTRAYSEYVEHGERLHAARVGFWLCLSLMLTGKGAQSSGWLSRTQRLITGSPDDCVEHGYLLVVSGLFALFKGDGAGSCAYFEQATSLAQRFDDTDLLAVSILSRGQALIQIQRADEGVVLLDEAMLAVTSGQVSPIMAGIIYCAVILTCERIYDLQRAHEWTVALDDWCASQPELVAFRGQCLLHHSELLQFRGDWHKALEEAEQARDLLAGRTAQLAGRALYQQAELHRLSGDLKYADEIYREAGTMGFEPQPGVSLLRLAQGDVKAASTSIRRVENEAKCQQVLGGGVQRFKILGPFVEIMLAAGDLESARGAADELVDIAMAMNALYLKATAAQMTGAVLLAQGHPEQALTPLREAWTLWQKLEVPYDSARVRVLIGRACELLRDGDTAKTHFDAATLVFERLGAAPELTRLRTGDWSCRGQVALITARERQVLALVASGQSNRQIAADLGISEHTVARHISNIFNKLGVSSRTAASAFAFENNLL